jgi:hypothetical protein
MAAPIPLNVSDAEFFKYYWDQATKDEIAARFERMAEKLEEFDGYEERVAKSYEVEEEQSAFRKDAIVEILELCDSYAMVAFREELGLVKDIRNLIENSYVEL